MSRPTPLIWLLEKYKACRRITPFSRANVSQALPSNMGLWTTGKFMIIPKIQIFEKVDPTQILFIRAISFTSRREKQKWKMARQGSVTRSLANSRGPTSVSALNLKLVSHVAQRDIA